MTALVLAHKARMYLQRLCRDIPTRWVGSQGNRLATDFFAETVAAFGFQTTCPPFDCIDWTSDGARLSVNGISFPASVSPYSPGCHVRGTLLAVATIDELEVVEARSSVLLARGELTKEPLMPKHFPFYNPDEHQRIIRALESKQPLAIIAATSRNPELAGALYPFPWIEDGDFDIPSVYMTDEEGVRLAAYVGKEVALDIHAQRIPATGCNVLARKGTDTTCRLVVCAHIDAKEGTPGALDNASGIVILLLLAELLADYRGNLGIELVALNGEDHYANPGEQQYLQMNAGKFDEIVLGINLDGVGYCHGNTAYSLYDCPPELAGVIQQIFSAHPTMIEGERWYQGDHGLFLIQQRPALALTSERSNELLSTIVHTPQDCPEIVDSTKLVASAYALRDLVVQLDQAKRTHLMTPNESELAFETITEADIPELTRVMTRAFDDDAQKHLGQERGGPPGYDTGDFFRQWLFGYDQTDGYKVLRAGQLVGAIIVWILPDGHNVLGTIFVDPATQDQGVGTRIWQFIEARYPETKSWRLTTPRWATKNHHFYAAKCGFERVVSDPIVGSPDDEYVYRKDMA